VFADIGFTNPEPEQLMTFSRLMILAMRRSRSTTGREFFAL
jgi:hypothetical protein